MSLPKLTIIIPTLQRPDTLYWTLRTVLEQDYENFSVLVSDNFSNDNTHDVVSAFNDKRVTYIKTDRKLSMSHHWEFAISHVADGYVTILGDDDGLLPNGLSKVAKIIERHNPLAIGWRFGNYNWKGLPPYFMIPLGNCYRIVNAKKEAKVLLKKNIYTTIQFPSLYGGFTSIQLIKKLKSKYNNTFFHSRIPDFFSGAIVAANVETYIRLEYPVTINATSKHSTGFATLFNTSEKNAFTELKKNDDSNIPFHSNLIFIRSNAVPIAEAMMQVKRLEPSFPGVNIEAMLQNVMNEAAACDSQNKYIEMVEGVTEMAKLNGIETFAKALIAQHPYTPVTSKIKNKFSPITNTAYIDTTFSTIENVYDACKVANIFTAKNLQFSNLNVYNKLTSLYGYLRYIKAKSSAVYKSYFEKQ